MKYVGIALAGKAGAGKDTVGSVLRTRYDFHHFSFAHRVKVIAGMCFGWDGVKDEKGRRLLQTLGTEAGRAYNQNVWVDYLLNHIDETEKRLRDEHFRYSPGERWKFQTVITDTRFVNEAETLRERGYLLVRVDRNVDRKGEWSVHESETALDDYPFDEIIDNSGTFEETYMQVVNLVTKYGF